ncbi:MAG: flagellar biosynthesis protein FlhF [Methylococcaceae bacterium]|nr:flagellar biosynthesis protein FlhF [Methylococcaceae bacterium]MCI0733586.1 flagellar biosynthesis protein FlhF [Methylococcaceae bacterium]
MKIRRFCAPDIRQAMRLVREELGAEAVILSNRKVDEGIEIVAAMDFDQELFQNQIRGSDAADRRIPSTSDPAANLKSKPLLNQPGLSDEDSKSLDRSAGLIRAARSDSPVNPADPEPAASVAPNARPVLEPVIEEMRKEFDLMRDLLNSHMSDISCAESLRHNPVCREVSRRLNQLGFSDTISKKIIKQIGASCDFSNAWDKVKRSISRHFMIHDDNLLDHGGIVALIGPTGVGKTTSIAKLAARFCLKYGSRKIALVTADNYRIAAFEQLNTYGRILDIPVRTAHDNAELEKVLADLIDKRLVLIDTAGVSQRAMSLADRFPVLRDKNLPVRSYLVMSAATQYATMQEIIQAFRVFEPYAAILTKLDEAVMLGSAVSALVENRLSLSFVCDGQKVPENLRTAREYGLAERCFASAQAFPFKSANCDPPDQRIQACG